MRAYWFDQRERNAQDIARLIYRALSAIASPVADRIFGRGQLEDSLRRLFNEKRRQLGGARTANIIVASGIAQIGRETVLRSSLPKLFPGLPNIAGGPALELPTWADMRDVYRAVRENVEDPFSLESYEKDLRIFENLDEDKQVEEITSSLSHFGDIGEAVILYRSVGIQFWLARMSVSRSNMEQMSLIDPLLNCTPFKMEYSKTISMPTNWTKPNSGFCTS
jgi:hypothetical protein